MIDYLFSFIIIVSCLRFIIFEFIIRQFTPKKINSIYGYRTKDSMRNQKSWDFAQKQSSKLMIDISCYQIIFGLVVMILNLSVENSIFLEWL